MDALELIVAYIEKDENRYWAYMGNNITWERWCGRSTAFLLSLEAMGARYYRD